MHHKNSSVALLLKKKKKASKPSWQERSSEVLDKANCPAVWALCEMWVHRRPSQTLLEKIKLFIHFSQVLDYAFSA